MNFELVAFDLDGTVLYDNKDFSKRFLNDITILHSRGIKIVPVTGRPFLIVPEEILKLKGIVDYIVLCSGAEIRMLATEKIVATRSISEDFVLKFQKFADDHKIPIYYHTTVGPFITEKSFENDVYFAKQNERVAAHFEKIILNHVQRIDNIDLMLRKNPQILKTEAPIIPEEAKDETRLFLETNNVEAAWTEGDYIEITDKLATKGEGLKFVCKRLGVDLSKTFAIGDSANDIAMLQTAGFGVAMANAQKELKDIADAITITNEEDGAAIAVEKYVMEQP